MIKQWLQKIFNITGQNYRDQLPYAEFHCSNHIINCLNEYNFRVFMHIPKTFFILALITSTCSLRSMNFDELPQNVKDSICTQLIKNIKSNTSYKTAPINKQKKIIRKKSKPVKALSLSNKDYFKRLNNFYFTDMLIQSLKNKLCLNEICVANNIITAGTNIWRQKYLEGMNFY